MMRTMQMRRMSVLGLGLLGASLTLAIRKVAPACRLVGYAHRAETRTLARDRGVVDEVFDDPAAAVEGADWVVLCTPVGVFGDLIGVVAPRLAEDAIITDVGSTKRSFVRLADRLPKPAMLVGSHPMAGSEKRGLEFADAGLFRGAVCVVTPTPASDENRVAKVETLWQSVGMTTLRMSPEEHDARVALASHLPHTLAAALMLLQDEKSLAVSGKGLADTTRVAAGDAGLWRDILVDNADNLKEGIRRTKAALDELASRLDAGDTEAVKDWLARAAQMRQAIVKRPSA